MNLPSDLRSHGASTGSGMGNEVMIALLLIKMRSSHRLWAAFMRATYIVWGLTILVVAYPLHLWLDHLLQRIRRFRTVCVLWMLSRLMHDNSRRRRHVTRSSWRKWTLTYRRRRGTRIGRCGWEYAPSCSRCRLILNCSSTITHDRGVFW